jgi:ABC-type multidrug transport system fused ATPase/permease subunit
MLELYKRIWIVTGRSQALLIVLSIAIAVLAAVPLKLQKEIINGVTGSMQLRTLLILGAGYLGVLLVRNALKFVLQYKSSMLSEGVIRRIRNRIYDEKAKDTERGTVVEMIASEAEEVGRFAGTAMAAPLMQLGTLVSVIGYIASAQPVLGAFMIAIVVPQAVIAVAVQQRINDRVAHRVKVLRRATHRIAAEDIESAGEAVRSDFDEIYEARRRVFIFKFSSKLAMNVLTALGTAGILVLGGVLVIKGRTDVGTVVAALSGLTRINEPWRELIAFYRDLSIVRIKFELLLAAQTR